MASIYYLFGIVAIIYEISWIISPIRKTKEARYFFEKSEEYKGKKWDDYPEEYKNIMINNIPLIFILLWILMGLITSQWLLYLIIIAFNIIIVRPLSKLTKFTILYTILHWINSVIGISFLIFVIVNHYHLNINVTELLIQLK